MKIRVISSLVAGGMLIGALIVSQFFPEMLHIVVAVISAVAAYEVTGAAGTRKSRSVTAASIVTAAAFPFTMLSKTPGLAAEILVCAYALFVFAMELRKHKDIPMPNMMVNVLLTLLVPASLSHMVTVRLMGGDAHGIFLLVMMLLAAWSSDTGAYFAGVNFGKHKLCPVISPKKTVEGFIGGILSCIAILELVAFVYGWLIAPDAELSYIAIAVAAAVCSVISVLGDLTFSLLKRHVGIKDYGNIMPGHGGALDRFDSVIFVAPVFTLLITYFPIIHV